MKRFRRYAIFGGTTLVLTTFVLLFRADIPVDELQPKFTDEASMFLDLEGMQVHAKDEGSGPPLLLLHGTSASLHTWDGWTAELRDEFRVLRLDFPGFGLTGPDPTGDYSIERRVELVAAFLDLLGVERCAVAGNSLGGYIAWQFTARRPDRVDRLILLDAAGYRSGPPRRTIFDLAKIPVVRDIFGRLTPRFLVEAGLRQSYADESKITPELIDRYYALLLREGNRRALMESLQHRRASDEARVATITQPTLILWGREDRLIPVEHAELFHRDLTDSRLVIYDDIGHVPMEEIPVRSARDARRFLLETASTSAPLQPR